MKNAVCILFLFVSCFSCGTGERTAAEDGRDESAVSLEKVPDSLVYAMKAFDDRLEHEIGTRDLGRLRDGEVVKGVLYLRNESGKPLVFMDVRGACGCVTLTYDKRPIENNKMTEIPFYYNSKGKEGKQVTSISLITDAAKYEVRLIADVRPNE